MSRSPLADIHRMPLLLYAIAFSACTNPTTPPQEPPTLSTYVVPASIDPTGTQDVSASLQAWIDSLPDSSRILGPPGARYRIEFGLEMVNRRGLQFDAVDPNNRPKFFQTLLEPHGPSAGLPDGDPVYEANRNRHVLSFRQGGGHSVRNWNIQGGQPNSGVAFPYLDEFEAQHGIEARGVDGMVIEDVFITEVAGDFIYLDNWVQGTFQTGTNYLTRDVIIRRVTARKAARQGISPISVINGLIENCDLQDINRSGIDIEPLGLSVVQNLMVRNNYFAKIQRNWVAGHGHSNAIVENITFENNEIFDGPPKFMLRGQRTTDPPPRWGIGRRRSVVRVANNYFHGLQYNGETYMRLFEFAAIDSVEVINNIVEFDGMKPFLVGGYFNETCGITYSGNTWGNAEYDHEVVIGYDSLGNTITEYGGLNMEWPRCGELVRMSR